MDKEFIYHPHWTQTNARALQLRLARVRVDDSRDRGALRLSSEGIWVRWRTGRYRVYNGSVVMVGINSLLEIFDEFSAAEAFSEERLLAEHAASSLNGHEFHFGRGALGLCKNCPEIVAARGTLKQIVPEFEPPPPLLSLLFPKEKPRSLEGEAGRGCLGVASFSSS